MLKKLSIIVLSVLLLVFCASCSKNEIKDDVKNAEQKIIKTLNLIILTQALL